MKSIIQNFLRDNQYRVRFLLLGEVELEPSSVGEGGNGLVYAIKNIENIENTNLVVKFLASNDDRKLKRFKDDYLQVVYQRPRFAVTYILYDELNLNGNIVSCVIMRRYKQTLATWRKNTKNPTNEVILDIMKQLVAAVSDIHSRGIIHRDIKPQNILLDDSNNLYLTDFGIAHFMDCDLPLAHKTKAKERLSNRYFSAPEQELENKCKPARTMDIYAVAMVMYYLVHGKHHSGSDIIRLPKFESYEDIITRALSSNPESRPQDVQELLNIKTSPSIFFGAVDIVLNFDDFVRYAEPDIMTIQFYTEDGKIKKLISELIEQPGNDNKLTELYMFWDEGSNLDLDVKTIRIEDYPFVKIGINRYKITKACLVRDEYCFQRDNNYMLLYYEPYKLPNGTSLDYLYKGKQVSAQQVSNGVIKHPDGSKEIINSDLLEVTEHQNKCGVIIIGTKFSRFYCIENGMSLYQFLSMFKSDKQSFNRENILALLEALRKHQNSDVNATT